MQDIWDRHAEQAGEDTRDGVVFIQKLLGHNNIKTPWLSEVCSFKIKNGLLS